MKWPKAVEFFWWLLMKSREAFSRTRLEKNFRNLKMLVMVDADDETEEGKASVEEARSAYNEKDLSGDGHDRPTADESSEGESGSDSEDRVDWGGHSEGEGGGRAPPTPPATPAPPAPPTPPAPHADGGGAHLASGGGAPPMLPPNPPVLEIAYDPAQAYRALCEAARISQNELAV